MRGEGGDGADEGGGFEGGVKEEGGEVTGADGGLETLHRPVRDGRGGGTVDGGVEEEAMHCMMETERVGSS